MIPYITIPDLPILGPIGVHAFGVMVAAAVLAGIHLGKKYAPVFGETPEDVDSLSTWVLIGGFLGAHLVDRLFYFPGEVAKNPWTLIEIWDGLSSFGAGLGGAVGIVAWTIRRRKPFVAMGDLTASILPVSWGLGRVGCALVHDHLGIRTSASNPFAVAFPDGPRYDLGFLEMLFWGVLSLVFWRAWRKPHPRGTYIAWLLTAYMPVRFGLDFLRVDDARYAGLTPAQWLCMVIFVAGLAVSWRIATRGRAPAPPAAPSPTAGRVP
ncbi:MAG TPA: prolipoprotein diacylglyceryl transferase [bacterium]|nr:prolipoprotein diacylglyceryl transferase [bacterium]